MTERRVLENVLQRRQRSLAEWGMTLCKYLRPGIEWSSRLHLNGVRLRRGSAGEDSGAGVTLVRQSEE